nr:hypothetical protein CFP56_76848 [Quercus suber]
MLRSTEEIFSYWTALRECPARTAASARPKPLRSPSTFPLLIPQDAGPLHTAATGSCRWNLQVPRGDLRAAG